MRMKGLVLALAMATLSGCATQGMKAGAASTDIPPMDAIQRAAAAAPQRVPGVFVMDVRGTGEDRGGAYLNSEADYRDQRCLTIAMTPAVAEQLRRLHGGDGVSYYQGKRIRVRGEAVRARIDFRMGERSTGKYYYQTHVPVTDPDQITVVGEG